MTGMDAATGRPLAGAAHLAQSIGDILNTPIGSRVMLREYGSALFELLDGPVNPLMRLRLFAATAVAIQRWERRIRLTRVALESASSDGSATLGITGETIEAGVPTELVRLSIPLHPLDP